MRRPYEDLIDLEKDVLVLKQPGQRQSEESADRQRSFLKRAEAIETLKGLRLRQNGPVKAQSRSRRKFGSG